MPISKTLAASLGGFLLLAALGFMPGRCEPQTAKHAVIKPLPLPTEPADPWAGMSDAERLRGDAEVQP